MLDKFIFENHLGLRFDGLKNGVFLNQSELRDYAWDYETINSRISRFYKGVTERKIPLVVFCSTDAEAIAAKNRLHDLSEADIAAMIPGRIYVGDYYTRGYITASRKSGFLQKKRLCNLELSLLCDDPSWLKEKTYSFVNADTASSIENGTDYPYAYPYDYASSAQGQKIVCESSFGGNDFRLTVRGAVVNPSISIAGHQYELTGEIKAGESVTIDSLEKTIVHKAVDGTLTNWFDNRSRESYIFQSIPAGQHLVSWAGEFSFELTIIERRSEPKWT